MRKACLLPLLVICSVVGVWMTGCEPSGTVTGIITYQDGSPAAHVWVGAAEIDHYRLHDTQTDSAGRYVVEHAARGEWEITVNLENPRRQETYRLTVFREDQQNVFNIVLPYPPPSS